MTEMLTWTELLALLSWWTFIHGVLLWGEPRIYPWVPIYLLTCGGVGCWLTAASIGRAMMAPAPVAHTMLRQVHVRHRARRRRGVR